MGPPPTDERLMLQVYHGNVERLALLFDRYQIPLFNFFLRLSSDRQASEDMVQEVFVRILKYRQSFRPGATFRSWLYQVARNVRHDARPRLSTVPPVEAESPAIEPAAESAHDTALLQRALMALPEEKREVLILSRLEGLNHREIAEALGCQPGAAKVRIHRALKELRQQFFQLERHAAIDRPASGGSAP